MQFHIETRKKSRIIELLSNVDRRRNYNLYLCSCYFSPDAAREIISAIRKEVSIEKVNIYIDRREAIKHGSDSLIQFCRAFRGIDVSLDAIETSRLFHSKSYALISFGQDGEINSGSLVVGSANLTNPGCGAHGGNIECIMGTQDLSQLREHFSQTLKLNRVGVLDLAKFSDKDDFSFRYAVINSGEFLHEWRDNLEQYFAVKYRLSEEGRRSVAGAPILTNLGFDIDTATVSKRYFRSSSQLVLPDSTITIKRFGIDTHLGHWMPQPAIDAMFGGEDVDEFKNEIFNQIEMQVPLIQGYINSDLDALRENELIEIAEDHPFDLFKRKVADLKDNDTRLVRMYRKYSSFDLPYPIEDEEGIINLFDEMIKTCESKRRRNAAMRAILKVCESKDIESFIREMESVVQGIQQGFPFNPEDDAD